MLNRFFRNSIVCISFTFAGVVHAQSVFNVLDSTNRGAFNVLVNETHISYAGWGYNPSGSRTVIMSKHDPTTGNLILVDTLSPDGIASYNSALSGFPEDSSRIVLLNIENPIPPFNTPTGDIQLNFMDTSFIGQGSYLYGGNDEELTFDMLTYGEHLFLLGSSSSYANGDYRYYLQKSDTLGNELWHQIYGNGTYEEARSLVMTKDSNLLIIGVKYVNAPDWDIHMVKVSPDSGQIIWEKQYGGPYSDSPGRITSLYDHSYIVYHNLDDLSVITGYIEKIDGNGDIIWSKAFPNGNLSTFSWAKAIENPDGTLMVLQFKKNAQYQIISSLIKLAPTGEVIWSKDYYTRPDYPNYIYDMKPTGDGGYILGGAAFPTDTVVQQGWLIRTNCLGEDGTQYPVSGAPCDQYDCNLYPIDANFTPSTTFIDLATDPGLVTFENNTANATSRVWNFGNGVTDYTDSIMSYTFTQPGIYDVELIVFHGMCSDTVIQTIEVVNTSGIMSPNLDFGVSVYPNPSSGSFIISFKHAPAGSFEIVDLAGRTHREGVLNGSLKYPVYGLDQGAYLLQIYFPSGVRETIRVVVD